MPTKPLDPQADPLPATEMVKAFGMRLAPGPTVGAVAGGVLCLTLAFGWWGVAALAQAALPMVLVSASVYWAWRWVDERHGKVYWEPAPMAIEAVAAGTWMPSSLRAGCLSRVTAAGVADDRPWLRLGEGSMLVAEPPRGDVVTALLRPAPWHGVLESVPVPDRRTAAELSDDELRAAVKRSFARLAAVVEETIDSGELFDRELLVDLARFLEKGMETVRAYESVSGRLRTRPEAAAAVGEER
ncbi:MAG TPA: hypothetical protein VM390_05880 [Acidimicrobiales bacterium]|nr:hypothetical protein [Acidimicrobiales bacterium]